MDTLPQKDTVQRLLRPVVFLFFAAYLALGLVLVDDYGLTWDEEYERLHGLVVFDCNRDSVVGTIEASLRKAAWPPVYGPRVPACQIDAPIRGASRLTGRWTGLSL